MPGQVAERQPALLFDLDGTLVDSVYQHVLAWREALEEAGIGLSVWRIHRRIGMSGGLFVNALARETGRHLAPKESRRIQEAHVRAFVRRSGEVRPVAGSRRLLEQLGEMRIPVGDCYEQRSESSPPNAPPAGASSPHTARHSRRGSLRQAGPHLFLTAAIQN